MWNEDRQEVCDQVGGVTERQEKGIEVWRGKMSQKFLVQRKRKSLSERDWWKNFRLGMGVGSICNRFLSLIKEVSDIVKDVNGTDK